ncbi:MAG: flagellar hook-associated protein FlgK [Bacilli bacterium]
MSISTFSVLNIGVTALDAMQQAQAVVANNMANANTPGYVQESAALAEAPPYPPLPSNNAPMISGQLGQGVQVAAINRQTSAFVNQQDRANQGAYNMYKTHSQNLSSIEAILNEPSSQSMQNALDQFFQSWQTLSTDPSNAAARQSVLSSAQTLGQTFQTVTTQLQQTQTNLGTAIIGQLGELNQYASQVATLNKQIAGVLAAGENPNQLLDQRGVLLNQMAGLAGISYSQDPSMNGAVNVSIQTPSGSTIPLVTGATAKTYPPGATVSPTTLQPQTTSIASLQPYLSDITSGSIAGNVQSYDDTSNVLSNLDATLTQFANTVNGQQQKGYNFNSSTHSPALFAINYTAANHVYLSLASGLTPDQVGAAGSANQPGDNANALAVTQLQNQSHNFTYSYNSLATNTTVSSAYSGTFDQALAQTVANIGVETAAVNSSQATAQALSQQSSQMRQSISGVDQNQQAANMVAYQNSYNAAAKFISIFDQMLQTLISNV